MIDTLDQVKAALAGQYTIERELGRGAMAIVYLADDAKHQRKVALKVLRSDLAASLGAERFLREIRTVAGLAHPNILPLHDSGEADGALYYTMPYLHGASLRDRLSHDGQFPVEDAVQIAEDVAHALGFAHAQGIVHRDIKPENILLQAGRALVADFGIARVVGDVTDTTIAGLAIGTPPYMSPEQTLGDPVDGRADIYSLGTVLYELLAGKPPFTGPTMQDVLVKVLREDPPPLRTFRSGLPASLEATVARAMARRPEERYQTVDELLVALRKSLTRRISTPSGTRRRPSPLQVASLFGLSAAAALAAIYNITTVVHLPPWTFMLAEALAAIGIPLGILTARAERRRHAGLAPPGLGRWVTWRNWAVGGVLALITWATVATVLVVRRGGGVDAGTPRVAVLPFANLGEPGDAYFSQGVADEIRGTLVDLPNVRVIARESSDGYAASGKSWQEIGEELGADFVLTGTARWEREGGGRRRVELAPELFDAHTGNVRWRETFMAESADVFRIQAEIVVRAVAALDIALGATEREAMAAPPTTSAAAYDAYLRALNEGSHRGDATALRQAINLFQRAVALDSTFLDAWIGLSKAASGLYVATADSEVGKEARAAAERALVLAPNDADAHDVLVQYYLTVAGDAARAARAAAEGLRISSGHAGLLARAATAEQQLGRWEDALRHLEDAEALDPRSAEIAGARGYLLLRLRRYREAHAAYGRALALDPENTALVIQHAMVYLAEGDLDGARAAIRDGARRVDETELAVELATYYDLYWLLSEAQQNLVLRLPPSAFLRERTEWSLVRMQMYAYQGNQVMAQQYADSARVIAEEALRVTPDRGDLFLNLGLALAYLHRPEAAIRAGRRALDLLPMERDAIARAYAEHQLVRIYLLAGQRDQAMDHIEALLAVPYYLSPGWLRVDPTFAPLRGNARFERLAHRPRV